MPNMGLELNDPQFKSYMLHKLSVKCPLQFRFRNCSITQIPLAIHKYKLSRMMGALEVRRPNSSPRLLSGQEINLFCVWAITFWSLV